MLVTAAPVVFEASGGRVRAGEGPDGIISHIGSGSRIENYGHEDPNGTGDFISAFSLGFTWCNTGTEPLYVVSATGREPGMVQSLYRLKAGRFEQLGMSWFWHSVFYALNSEGCGLTCMAPADSSGTQTYPGCSEYEPSYIVGARYYMSPTSDVNAFTGVFPPESSLPEGSGAIANRLQVHDYDLDPSLNEGALYFVQVQQVHPQDAAAGNAENDASYSQVAVTYSTKLGRYVLSVLGPTQTERSAIHAWRDFDPDVIVTKARAPGEGLFRIAVRVSEAQPGWWHYEYAVQNENSDRSGESFTVPLPVWASIENIGFHDVDYHSGEPWDGTDWAVVVEGDSIRWATVPYDENLSANALRWGTLYNFRFDANVPPKQTLAQIGLFKPGVAQSVMIGTLGPTLCDGACLRGDSDRDGDVDLRDVGALMTCFTSSGGVTASLRCALPFDAGGDSFVDLDDFPVFFDAYSGP